MPNKNITDREAVRIALHLAIDAEETSMEYATDRQSEGYKHAAALVSAFRRVLERRYGNSADPAANAAGKSTPVLLGGHAPNPPRRSKANGYPNR